MSFIDPPVVGSNNKDRIIQHTGIFYSFYDLSDITIQYFQHIIILRGVMAIRMADMIRVIKNDRTQVRFGRLDIVDSITSRSIGFF